MNSQCSHDCVLIIATIHVCIRLSTHVHTSRSVPNCFEKTPARYCPQLFFVDAVSEVVKPLMVDFLAAEFFQPVAGNNRAVSINSFVIGLEWCLTTCAIPNGCCGPVRSHHGVRISVTKQYRCLKDSTTASGGKLRLRLSRVKVQVRSDNLIALVKSTEAERERAAAKGKR